MDHLAVQEDDRKETGDEEEGLLLWSDYGVWADYGVADAIVWNAIVIYYSTREHFCVSRVFSRI